jgi:hypothetical protein
MKNTFLFICLVIFAITTPKIYAQPIFEFRGVWVASVENIDLPSRKGLSVDDQKMNSLSC